MTRCPSVTASIKSCESKTKPSEYPSNGNVSRHARVYARMPECISVKREPSIRFSSIDVKRFPT